MGRACAVLVMACMVACTTPHYDHRGSVFSALPDSWQQAEEWQFFFVDRNREPIGHLHLHLTRRTLESEDCDVSSWYRADVIENSLEYELDAELAPGYVIAGPWITVDLAATSCNIAYKLIGKSTDEGAIGHFNVVHSLGGENIGEFVALPADPKRDDNDKQAFSIQN